MKLSPWGSVNLHTPFVKLPLSISLTRSRKIIDTGGKKWKVSLLSLHPSVPQIIAVIWPDLIWMLILFTYVLNCPKLVLIHWSSSIPRSSSAVTFENVRSDNRKGLGTKRGKLFFPDFPTIFLLDFSSSAKGSANGSGNETITKVYFSCELLLIKVSLPITSTPASPSSPLRFLNTRKLRKFDEEEKWEVRSGTAGWRAVRNPKNCSYFR